MSSTDVPEDPPGARWPVMSIAEAHARLTAPGARFEMETLTIFGVSQRVWKNAPQTLRDIFVRARSFGPRTCLVYEDERVSYDAFARAVCTLATRLRADGVRPGDRVALLMRNLPEWPVAMLAACLCGAIATPCNAWGSAPELVHALFDSGARVAIVDAERWVRIEAHLSQLPALERVYVARGDVDRSTRPGLTVCPLVRVIGRSHTWSQLVPVPLPELACAPDDDAVIFYTSGTTGKPKGAVCTHRNVCSNTLTTACAQARAYLRRGQEPPSGADPHSAPQKAILLSVPMFHVMGCMPWMIAGLYQGSKIVLMHKWDAERALALIAGERITQAGGVPMMASQLLDHPRREDYDLTSLESVSFGGAPAAPELARKVRTLVPRAQPSNGWGMTEVTSSFASNGAEDYLARPHSCGVPAPVNDWKVMSEDGTHALPPGEVGELWVRGPQVVRGYWNDPDATRAAIVDGWLRTGDLARIDGEGFGTIVDRAKDMLIRGGENIYCVEIENVLFEHPGVLDAAVIGQAHAVLGEEPVAVVQRRSTCRPTEAELCAFIAAQLAAFKVPVRVVFTEDPLPRNAAGKVLKRELKARLAAASAV